MVPHVILSWIGLPNAVSSAVFAATIEASDPYLELSVDKQVATPGEALTFLITVGNRGPSPAENLTVSLNLPLDGRAPLLLTAAEPQPSRVLTSELGNLLEFSIPRLVADQATQAAEIRIQTRVRESIPSQTMQVDATLIAPKREVGQRQIRSNNLALLLSSEGRVAVATETAKTLKQPPSEMPLATPTAKTAASPAEPQTLEDRILGSDAIWSTAGFLVVSLLIVLAFIAGRRSKHV